MRIHVLPEPPNMVVAARFIANALLLSHSIRRDTEAWVRIGDLWLIARGRSVRQLRPDEESLLGWISAVLRGARLGAELRREVSIESPLCLGGEGDIVRALRGGGRTIVYGSLPGLSCASLAADPLPGRPELSVVIVNVLLDNIEHNSPLLRIIGGDEEGGATPRGEERLTPESSR